MKKCLQSMMLLLLVIAPSGLLLHAAENFDSLKQTLDKSIETVGKDVESKDLKTQLYTLMQEQSNKQTLLESIRRQAFKSLLITFSDTCIPAGSGKTMLQDRLRLLETSLSVYAGFLSRFLKKLAESKTASGVSESQLALIQYELKEVMYWKDFIHETLGNR